MISFAFLIWFYLSVLVLDISGDFNDLSFCFSASCLGEPQMNKIYLAVSYGMSSCFEASNKEILRESMSLNSAFFFSLESRCADLLIVLVISNLILIMVVNLDALVFSEF